MTTTRSRRRQGMAAALITGLLGAPLFGPGLTATPGTQGQRPWPTARGCFSLTYSDAHGLVMFGGSPTCGLQPAADLRVWSWNGVGWTAITTVPGEVGAREDAILVYDTSRKALILYGGRRGSIVFADTWEWNGQRWRQRASDAGPGMLEHAAGAFDAKRGRLVVFGGGHRSRRQEPYRNTWEWDGVTWTQVAPQGQLPEARVGHAMTWSPRHGEVLLYGGFARQPFRDLWAWNGTRWRRLDDAGPGSTEGPRAVAGPTGLFVLPEPPSGGRARAWVFSDAWSQVGEDGPETLIGQAAIYDRARGRLVVLGGHTPDRPATRDEVWEFDGRTWTTTRRDAR